MKLLVNVVGLIVFLALPLAAAFIGGLATASSVDSWYAELTKPDWTPPGRVIGAVWSVLYPVMGIAAWFVWLQRERASVRVPLMIWAIHLPFNALWSILFFGLQSPGLAFTELILLWLLIALATVAFYTRSIIAGALMTPYLLWVAFAGVLNFRIWWMNL